MNDLVDFFKRKNKKQNKRPVRTIVYTRGPAVTNCAKILKNGFCLVTVMGVKHGDPLKLGPAVNKYDNDNNTL